ncbi:Bifunctional purine biosynthesis protein PurH [Basidiobolus ranarum]|uniref:Bifunctional purine biosynthesis protein PurH n=1 Tax=Basidiobolus ranarum TaxID=34480 RepID=A0ABR2WV06_9FUNG
MKDKADVQIFAVSQALGHTKADLDVEIHTYDSTDCKISPYIAFSVFTAALSTFITGFNVGSPNTPQHVIIGCNLKDFPESALPACLPMAPIVWGFTLATFALGSLFAGLGAGSVVDRIGRKKALWFNNIYLIIAGVLISTSTSVPHLIIGRFFAGLGGGSACVFVSVYNSEIAPPRCKGMIGTMAQVSVVSGVLTAQALSLVFTYIPGWRILFALTAVPCVLQIILLSFCTETPAWLISQGRIDEARVALRKLRRGYNTDSEFDMLYQKNSFDLSNTEGIKNSNQRTVAKRMGLAEILSKPEIRRGLFNALIIHGFQQLCGINAVVYYSTSIFQSVLGSKNSGIFTVMVAVTNLTVSLFSTILVDRLGRKPLLLFSSFGMCLSSVMIVTATTTGINIMVVISVMLFVACFATGLGPLPWLLVPELLPPTALGTGASLCSAVNWFFNFVIGFMFPIVKQYLGEWAFLPFAVTTCSCA